MTDNYHIAFYKAFTFICPVCHVRGFTVTIPTCEDTLVCKCGSHFDVLSDVTNELRIVELLDASIETQK